MNANAPTDDQQKGMVFTLLCVVVMFILLVIQIQTIVAVNSTKGWVSTGGNVLYYGPYGCERRLREVGSCGGGGIGSFQVKYEFFVNGQRFESTRLWPELIPLLRPVDRKYPGKLLRPDNKTTVYYNPSNPRRSALEVTFFYQSWLNYLQGFIALYLFVILPLGSWLSRLAKSKA